jgi:hypothetical protein
MQPETESPKPDTGKNPKGFKQHARLVWDSFWELLGRSTLGKHLWGEIPSAVKHSTFLFVSCIFAIAILYSKGCEKDSQITTLKSDKEFFQRSLTTAFQTNSSLIQSYQLQFATLTGKIQERDTRISELIQERDKAQIESQNDKNALASWIILAKSSNTNTPLTERLDILTGWVEANTKSLTNALSSIGPSMPEFELYVNGILITNDNVISLKESRQLQLKVFNKTQATAEQLSVGFLAPFALATSNVIASTWELSPGATGFENGHMTDKVAVNCWIWTANKSLGGFSGYNVNTIEISTNYPAQTYPVLPVKFYVYSNRSKYQAFVLFLTF